MWLPPYMYNRKLLKVWTYGAGVGFENRDCPCLVNVLISTVADALECPCPTVRANPLFIVYAAEKGRVKCLMMPSRPVLWKFR